MFIIYHGNDEEVIITTRKKETQTIQEYFTDGKRDLEDYDRSESKECAVQITPCVRVD